MTLIPHTQSGQLTTASATSPVDLRLRLGPTWPSFEQLRLSGGSGIHESLAPGSVGRLVTKEAEFAILRWHDFDYLYGMAHDVQRLAQGVVLLRQAAEVVLKSEDKELGIQMIRDMSLQYHLPLVARTDLPPVQGDVEGESEAEAEPGEEPFVAPRPDWR